MTAVKFLEPWQLRAAFARSLSDMYGTEVPAYTTLLDVSHEVNADFVARNGADAERLGSIARVDQPNVEAQALTVPAIGPSERSTGTRGPRRPHPVHLRRQHLTTLMALTRMSMSLLIQCLT